MGNGETVLNGLIHAAGWAAPLTLNVNWGDQTSNTYNYSAGTDSFEATHDYAIPSTTGINDTVILSLSDDNGADVTTEQTSITPSASAPLLPVVSFDPSTIQQVVTADGNPAGTDVTFQVDLSQAQPEPLVVPISACGSALVSAVGLPGPIIMFNAGQTRANFVVHVNCPDEAVGPVYLTLVPDSQGGGTFVAAAPPATLTVNPSPASITVDTPTASEFAGQMTFTVTGSQLSGPETLYWQTQDTTNGSSGLANGDPLLVGVQDYVPAFGWTVLSPLQTTATIHVTLLGENNSDSTKSLVLNVYPCPEAGAKPLASASPVATGAGTIINSSALLHVAAILDNQPNGNLPMSVQTTTGAFIPVDNGDADYDGILDYQDPSTQPVPGDDRLLPISLQAGATLPAGGYYTLTVPSFLSVWLNSDRSGLVLDTSHLPATQSPIKLYLEATSDLVIPSLYGAELITLVWHDSNSSHTLTSFAKITPFELDGPLDVPGRCTYEYTCSTNGLPGLPNGAWLPPGGGTLAAEPAPTSYSASVTWNANAGGSNGFVGHAWYQASQNYVWGADVNVVSISISGTLDTNNPPRQVGAMILSNPVGEETMVSDLMVSANGPIVNGQPRGLSFIQMGFVQTTQSPTYRALYRDAVALLQHRPSSPVPWTADLQGLRLLDLLGKQYDEHDKLVWPAASWRPWYNSWNLGVYSTRTPTPHGDGFDLPIVDEPFGMYDSPFSGLLQFADVVRNRVRLILTALAIVVNFDDYFAVRTEEEGPTHADSKYFALASDSWTCNMSGTVSNGTYTPSGGSTTRGSDHSSYTLLSVPDCLSPELINGPIANTDQGFHWPSNG